MIYWLVLKKGGELELSYDKPVVGTTWSYTEDGELSIGVYHSAGDNYSATAYGATANNINSPTVFTGTHYWWALNANGIGSSGPKCPLKLIKI